MKVSIIIPFHDGSRDTLRWTIQSALRQTYPNYEIILVNDGCKDDNVTWSAKYMALKRQGTQIINQKNQGVVAARNAGWKSSNGEALLFLDSDDWIEPTFLEKTVPHLYADVGIVMTDMHVFGQAEDSVVESYPQNIQKIVKENQIPNTSLILRKAFEQAGGYKNGVYEDWELWINILKHGWKTAFVGEPLLHYRKHSPGESRISELTSKHEELVTNMKVLHPEVSWL